MSIHTAKSLTRILEAVSKSFGQHNKLVHEAACSCVEQARNGNVDWINDLHIRMPKLYQDAMKAWLSPKSKVFGELPWIRFDKDSEKYAIVAGTVSARPSAELIEKVSNDMAQYMMAKTAAKVQSEMNWEDELERKIKGIVTFSKNNESNIPQVMQQTLDEFAAKMQREIARLKLRRLDEQAMIETATPSPIVIAKPKAKAVAKAKKAKPVKAKAATTLAPVPVQTDDASVTMQ